MKLLTTHAFNCIVLMVKFGRTSCEDIPLALQWIKMALVPSSSVEKLTNNPSGMPLYPVSTAIIILTRVRGIVTVK